MQTLTTNVAPGDTGHDALHNAERTRLNLLSGNIEIVNATGINDSAAILAAFNALKKDGTHAEGTLYIRGNAALNTALDLNGGYSDTENVSNWGNAGTARFRLIADSLTPAAGLGNALTIHGFYGAVLDVHFRDGGNTTDNALNIYDHQQMDLRVTGVDFAGTLLYMDTYVAGAYVNARRVRGSIIREINATKCGRALYIRGIEAFGRIEQVWDNNCVNGSYFGFCADIGIGHYENFSPATQTYGLTFECCNSFNTGVISLGDRATSGLLYFVGNTVDPAGVTGSSNFGSIQRIRTSGYMPTAPATINGVKIENVNSIQIDNLHTFRCVIGLNIIGSNVRVKAHQSMTADVNAVKIAGSTFNASPYVDIEGHYRFTYGQPVTLDSTLTVNSVVKIAGYFEGTNNSSATASTYAVGSASTGWLDVAGLTVVANSNHVGLTNHATAKLRGVIEAHSSITPPAKGSVFFADGTGNLTRVGPGTNGQVPVWQSDGSIAAATPATVPASIDTLNYLATQGIYPTLWYTGTAFPARSTITSGYTGKVVYDSTLWPGVTGPTDRLTNDIWSRAL